jgi:hypothetical protein
MIRQPEAVEEFLVPVRENLAEAKGRFDAFVKQSRTLQERQRIQRRLIGGTLGCFALAGLMSYQAATSTERAYMEPSANDSTGAAGDLLAAGVLVRVGTRLASVRSKLSPTPVSPAITPADIPTRLSPLYSEYQLVQIGRDLPLTPASPAAASVINMPPRTVHEDNEHQAAA